jgi:2-polyprenyl-3-methyl-5-hydroxy-6-metoxy-1,4-benzoquinol methylase
VVRSRAETEEVSAELRRELEQPPLWMYPWGIGAAGAPIHSDALPEIHAARLAMMEAAVREVLDAAERPTVIDLACNEGWFSHRLLEWGAEKVVGIDIREVNVRRAKLIAEHLGIGEDRLEFRVGDVYDLDFAEHDTFDVVLLLGLIYHVEDPVRAVRIARGLSGRLCVIESQLTRQAAPVAWGRGPGHTEFAPASFAAYPEPDAEVNPVASEAGVLSLIPNAEAVREMARAAGFSATEQVAPGPTGHSYYLAGDRGLFCAWTSERPTPPVPSPARPPAPPPTLSMREPRLGLHTAISLSRRIRSRRRVSSQLEDELAADPPWMYPWRFGAATAPIHHEMLASVHRTRAEMIEAPVREALAAAATLSDPTPSTSPPSDPASRRPRAIDLACNEGWFSHRLLEWGAESVLGVDIREVNIRRARLVARELGLDRPGLEFRQSDVFDLRPEQLGRFDVVFLLGLIYHVEDPAGTLRIARAMTRSLCVIDTQLTRQVEPLPWTAQDGAESGSFALQIEKDSAVNPLASSTGRMSLIPNRAAVEEMAIAAGFDEVEMLTPPPLADIQYQADDRGVFIARVNSPEA